MTQAKPVTAKGHSILLEWIAGGIGLMLTLGLLGFFGWQAWLGGPADAPRLTVSVERVIRAGDHYIAAVAVHNRARATAQDAEIEGRLTVGAAEPEVSTHTFDYVPGGATMRADLHFVGDPSTGGLRVRVVSHREP